MIKATFPGSFDPPTNGHFDIIRRCAAMFDALDVVVAVNRKKTPMLSQEVRKNLLEEEIAGFHLDNVKVKIWDGLMVEYCRLNDVGFMVRGLRNASDFDPELELALINRLIVPEIETIFLHADPALSYFRASHVREMVALGLDISSLVPKSIVRAIEKSRI